jgi:hypothetical protein
MTRAVGGFFKPRAAMGIERPTENWAFWVVPVLLGAGLSCLSLVTSFDCFDSNRDFLENTLLLAK